MTYTLSQALGSFRFIPDISLTYGSPGLRGLAHSANCWKNSQLINYKRSHNKIIEKKIVICYNYTRRYSKTIKRREKCPWLLATHLVWPEFTPLASPLALSSVAAGWSEVSFCSLWKKDEKTNYTRKVKWSEVKDFI